MAAPPGKFKTWIAAPTTRFFRKLGGRLELAATPLQASPISDAEQGQINTHITTNPQNLNEAQLENYKTNVRLEAKRLYDQILVKKYEIDAMRAAGCPYPTTISGAPLENPYKTVLQELKNAKSAYLTIMGGNYEQEDGRELERRRNLQTLNQIHSPLRFVQRLDTSPNAQVTVLTPAAAVAADAAAAAARPDNAQDNLEKLGRIHAKMSKICNAAESQSSKINMLVWTLTVILNLISLVTYAAAINEAQKHKDPASGQYVHPSNGLYYGIVWGITTSVLNLLFLLFSVMAALRGGENSSLLVVANPLVQYTSLLTNLGVSAMIVQEFSGTEDFKTIRDLGITSVSLGAITTTAFFVGGIIESQIGYLDREVSVQTISGRFNLQNPVQANAISQGILTDVRQNRGAQTVFKRVLEEELKIKDLDSSLKTAIQQAVRYYDNRPGVPPGANIAIPNNIQDFITALLQDVPLLQDTSAWQRAGRRFVKFARSSPLSQARTLKRRRT